MVVLAFAIVVLLIFSAFFVENIAPMFTKAKFDELCRTYLLIAEANNGLTQDQQKELEKMVENLGLKEVQIKVDDKDTVARRKMMSLDVEGQYVFRSFTDWIRREERALTFKFVRYFMARRIVE